LVFRFWLKKKNSRGRLFYLLNAFFSLVAQAFQPVLAQAKACGYISHLYSEPHT
jgi:hypothetical protein